jgi:hypothetical protein
MQPSVHGVIFDDLKIMIKRLESWTPLRLTALLFDAVCLR